MQTVLDSINAIATADQAVSDATSSLQSANAAVATAQATLTSAQAADAAADQQLSADLHATGPVFVLGQDGSATGYSYDASSPTGFDRVVFAPAGSVTSTSPSSTPTSTPSK